MNLNRSGYYKWAYRFNHPSIRQKQLIKDIAFIKEQSLQHKAHGYRWLTSFIARKYGVMMSCNYVYRCRKYASIICESKHYRWSKPKKDSVIFPNLVLNNWHQTTQPNQLFVSDSTGIYVKGKHHELTLYFDIFNREIAGYGLVSRHGDARQYFSGLAQLTKKIIQERETQSQPILHTDQGSTYSSLAFNQLLSDCHITHSMSRAGTPTDNPVNESLNGWIKEELRLDFNLKKSDNLNKLIADYIEYYNNERPMFCLQYKTPYQFKRDMGF